MTANVSIIVSSAPLFAGADLPADPPGGPAAPGQLPAGLPSGHGGHRDHGRCRTAPCRQPGGGPSGPAGGGGLGHLFEPHQAHFRLRLPTILTTRRVFFYGILFMLPVLAVSHPAWEPERFLAAENIGNLLFLGLGASALCFVSWNWAVGRLGPVKASAYIYLSPVVTLAASALLLHEPVTPAACLGTVLILGGLVLSEGRGASGMTDLKKRGCLKNETAPLLHCQA